MSNKKISLEFKISNMNEIIRIQNIMGKMFVEFNKRRPNYTYCVKKHLQFLHTNRILSFIYLTFSLKTYNKPYYLELNKQNNVSSTDINNFFTEDYKINNNITIEKKYIKKKYTKKKIVYNYPIEFIHPINGKILIKSYNDAIYIHLLYIHINDIEKSKKWLDIAMDFYDKPKYINYKII